VKLFPWARFRRRKGGIKAHTLREIQQRFGEGENANQLTLFD